MLSLDLLQSTEVRTLDLRYLGSRLLLATTDAFRLKTMLLPTYLRSREIDLWLGFWSGISSREPLSSRECSRERSRDAFLDCGRNLLERGRILSGTRMSNEFSRLHTSESFISLETLGGWRRERRDPLRLLRISGSSWLYSRFSSGLECAFELERDRSSFGGTMLRLQGASTREGWDGC